jgi:hypothetical protein
MAECARLRVDWVIITSISDNVEAAISATNGIAAKANATVSKPLAVPVPVRVTTPAVIYWIACSTGG